MYLLYALGARLTFLAIFFEDEAAFLAPVLTCFAPPSISLMACNSRMASSTSKVSTSVVGSRALDCNRHEVLGGQGHDRCIDANRDVDCLACVESSGVRCDVQSIVDHKPAIVATLTEVVGVKV